MSYYTDADIEMSELAAAGDMMANGVCHLCEDVLNPLAPKWAGHVWPQTRLRDGTYRATTAAEYADCLGPANGVVDGVHDSCAREAWGL